jgi:NNP family nitrate/nitrite transporter-like MFS transporter
MTWDPEDAGFWARTGARVARRNLIFSIFAEHVGFSVWSLWSVLVLFLTPGYGISHDLKTAAAEKFLLTTLPTALGSGLRIPYALAVARFGGRTWTVVSASLLLVPTVATAILLKPGVSYGALLVLAALAGVGGGNFASSMANINSFYPRRLKGWALGLNAGGGNIGVAVVQLVGLAVLAAAGKEHPRIMLGIYIPLVVIAALCAALFMDNLPRAASHGTGALRSACRDAHTWIISFLYIGSFGSFIGFSFAFGQVLQDQFRMTDPVKVASLTFLGPLVGSLIRPVGGRLADRTGGARITFWNFLGMAIAAVFVLVASGQRSLPLFYIGFIALFALSGLGNGSTYKMIPAIFGGDLAGAVIGIAGAVGAFGGVLVNIAFRQAFLATGTGDPAYLAFIAFYLASMATTRLVYLRPSVIRGRFPGLSPHGRTTNRDRARGGERREDPLDGVAAGAAARAGSGAGGDLADGAGAVLPGGADGGPGDAAALADDR